MFSKRLGYECIETGVSNPIVARFSSLADKYLRNRPISSMYCHVEFLAKKVKNVRDFNWDNIDLKEIIDTVYPEI